MVFWKAPKLLLRVHQIVVNADFKHAARPADQHGFKLKLLRNLGRQTGGLGEVVSDAAVFDRYFHVYETPRFLESGIRSTHLGLRCHSITQDVFHLFRFQRRVDGKT